MITKTNRTFQNIEEQRHSICSLYEGLSDDQLRFKPNPDHWNLLQVLRHLVTAEQQSWKYVQRKLDIHEKMIPVGFSSTLRSLILKIALKLPLKFKAPKISQIQEDAPDYKTMKSEWETVRRELEQIITSADDELLSKALYKHPRAGLLNIPQMLDFIHVHIKHHQKQIARIMRHHNFPDS